MLGELGMWLDTVHDDAREPCWVMTRNISPAKPSGVHEARATVSAWRVTRAIWPGGPLVIRREHQPEGTQHGAE